MNADRSVCDTSPGARAVQLELWRNMAPRERLNRAMALTAEVRSMAWNAVRRRHPALDDDQLRLKFIELMYGGALAGEVAAWMAERST